MRGLPMIFGLAVLLGGCNQSLPPPESEQVQIPTLQEFINDLQAGDERDRRTAAIALGAIGREANPALGALVSALLMDTNSEVRALAAMAVADVDPKGEQVLGPLGKATQDKDALVREKAAESIGRIGPRAESQVKPLIVLLKDRFAVVRCAAAVALGRIGPEAELAKAHLEWVVEYDGDDNVRKAASEAVKWIQSK